MNGDGYSDVIIGAPNFDGGQVDEPGGDVGDQRLELETVLEVRGRRLRFIERGHAAELYVRI